MFLNARPTGSLILLDGAGCFLSLLRAREPQRGLWELPGGFCDGFEAPFDAAMREGREELGAAVVLHDFVGMYVGEYLYQDELLPVLDSFWLATLAPGETITLDPDEASEMSWLPLAAPPAMAFRTMDRALRDAAAMVAGATVKKGSRRE
ncbi:8-oxo-dGTP pyrophosphatase MutT (NUDIX family) [Allocatelliglobosispora scoriae]|uniref:8-oxo-dGTP pyrophosphatase MutT (NUDIX family) n=1 Tax=Allocatelliglobosispora scoriae TaxID=643052 RepID=A0A841BNU5_9ACTN|nr:NUDIX hydrolase [Allocatelliglobosispora scoriae]MBB5869944.1 8-oxo-dGTP pyrophosphatase MutT (NUDIX family) [Allocatelliglobosispora scoriae]